MVVCGIQYSHWACTGLVAKIRPNDAERRYATRINIIIRIQRRSRRSIEKMRSYKNKTEAFENVMLMLYTTVTGRDSLEYSALLVFYPSTGTAQTVSGMGAVPYFEEGRELFRSIGLDVIARTTASSIHDAQD